MSARLANLQPRIDKILNSQGDTPAARVGEGQGIGCERTFAEGNDALLRNIDLANLTYAIAEGNLAGNVALGVAIGCWVTEGTKP